MYCGLHFQFRRAHITREIPCSYYLHVQKFRRRKVQLKRKSRKKNTLSYSCTLLCSGEHHESLTYKELKSN
jgi:hypothetical protein